MRDPNRISTDSELIKTFVSIWKQVPDQRFGQFITNLYDMIYNAADEVDPFFIEDGRMLDILKFLNEESAK